MDNERLKHQLEDIAAHGRLTGRSMEDSPLVREYMDHIRERSYLRHILAHHIQTNDYSRIRKLRQKHGM